MNLRQLLHRDKKSLFRGGPLMRVLPRRYEQMSEEKKRDGERRKGPGLIESPSAKIIGALRSVRCRLLGGRCHDVLSLGALKIDTGLRFNLRRRRCRRFNWRQKLKRGGKIGFARATALLKRERGEKMKRRGGEKMKPEYIFDRLVSDHLYDQIFTIKFRESSSDRILSTL